MTTPAFISTLVALATPNAIRRGQDLGTAPQQQLFRRFCISHHRILHTYTAGFFYFSDLWITGIDTGMERYILLFVATENGHP